MSCLAGVLPSVGTCFVTAIDDAASDDAASRVAEFPRMDSRYTGQSRRGVSALTASGEGLKKDDAEAVRWHGSAARTATVTAVWTPCVWPQRPLLPGDDAGRMQAVENVGRISRPAA